MSTRPFSDSDPEPPRQATLGAFATSDSLDETDDSADPEDSTARPACGAPSARGRCGHPAIPTLGVCHEHLDYAETAMHSTPDDQ